MSDDLVKRLRQPWYADRSIMSQTGRWMVERTEAADRIEELEAKLAKAVKALTLYIYETTHLSAEEDDGSHWCKISKDCLAQGRTALAEMKGDKDE